MFFTIIANTEQAAESGKPISHPMGSKAFVKFDGCSSIDLKDIGPSEVVVLINKA